MKITESLSPDELQMWLDNARYDYELADEKECIQVLFNSTPGRKKMISLLKSIIQVGFIRESLIVFDDGNKKVVLDGNRRLSLFKIKNYLDLIETYNISEEDLGQLKAIQSINCDIYNDIEEAYNHVESRHQGELDGAGNIPWSPQNKERFKESRGEEKSIGALVFEFFKNTDIPEYAFVKDNIQHVSTINRIVEKKCIFRDKFLLNNKKDYDFSNIYHTDKLNEMFTIFYERKATVTDVYTVKLIEEFFENVIPIPQIYKDGDKLLLQGTLLEETIKSPTITNQTTIVHSEELDTSESNREGLDASESTSTYTPPSEVVKQSRNTLKPETISIFSWKSSGISIDNNVLKHYIKELSDNTIDSSSDGLKKFIYHSAPIYYRIILECAVWEFTDFIKTNVNQKKFNLNNIKDADENVIDVVSRFTGTTKWKTSVVNCNKLHGVHVISKEIKSREQREKVKSITKELQQMSMSSESDYSKFIDDLNEIVHGAKIYLDDNTLKKYDKITLLILQLISTIVK